MKIADYHLKKQAEQQRRQLLQDAMFTGMLKQAKTSQTKLESTVSTMKVKAIEAEQAGRHGEAVQRASVAAKLSQQVNSLEASRNAAEQMHTIASVNRSMAQLAHASNEIVSNLNPAELHIAHAEASAARMQAEAVLEQQQLLFDNSDLFAPTESNPDGEAILHDLMGTKAPTGAQNHTAAILTDTEQLLSQRRHINHREEH